MARCLGDIYLVQKMGGATKKVWSYEKRMQSMMQMARIYMMVIKIHDCEEILKQKNSTQNNVFLLGRLKARKGKMRVSKGARFPIFFFPSEASLNNSFKSSGKFKCLGNSFASISNTNNQQISVLSVKINANITNITESKLKLRLTYCPVHIAIYRVFFLTGPPLNLLSVGRLVTDLKKTMRVPDCPPPHDQK